MSRKTTILLILDGFGVTDNAEGNAILQAHTPNINNMMSSYPYALGSASGLDVGLPDGQMGNSEVGHLNISAGRIVYQELTRITKSVNDGDFFENPNLLLAINNCKKHDSQLHIMGLLSDGGVHSHVDHLYALLKLAKNHNLEKVYVHAFMDGRDTSPTSGKQFVADLEKKFSEIGVGQIATISGRYYAMDRDNRYERVKLAYDCLALGKAYQSNSAMQCIEDSYKKEIYDEFILPTVIMKNDMPTSTIKENDSIIFFNFRPDRAREISKAFCDKNFSGFNREKEIINLKFVCFTDYDKTITNKYVAYTQEELKNTLGEYISSLNLRQLRIAETEKYAHVTFFFNGGRELAFEGEDRILIQSPKVPTYDLKPEMSSFEITDRLVESIYSNNYDLIIANYANPDMVGHTGVMDACVKAIQALDICIGKVLDAVITTNSQMFVCADHGNSDKLIDYITKESFTSHTTNPVPFIAVNTKNAISLKQNGRLCDIAPTILDMMELKKPIEMIGDTLLIKNN